MRVQWRVAMMALAWLLGACHAPPAVMGSLEVDGCVSLLQFRARLLLASLSPPEHREAHREAAPGAPPGENVSTPGAENLTELNASSVAVKAVSDAAVGRNPQLGNTSAGGNETISEGKSEAASAVSNETLDDVISKEAQHAATNRTVRRTGKDALDRERKGKKSPKAEKFDVAVKDALPNATIQDELNNGTIQQAIRERVKEAVDEEVAEKVAVEHRLPSREELNQTVTKELRSIWYDLIWARRYKQDLQAQVALAMNGGPLDWCLLSFGLLAFVALHHLLLKWPDTRTFHVAALLVWVAVAALYNCLVLLRLGKDSSTVWLIGYLLELIFSIENLFVFHIVVKAFRMPRWTTQRVLLLVVLSQAAFQAVFYMGLAAWLRSLKVLPYALGAWLIYVGWQAATEEEHGNYDVMQTRGVRLLRSFLGERLLLTQDDSSSMVLEKAGKTCLTPAGLMLLCLVFVDFLLEVDVTVVKIESFPSRYICFSSSLLASFALPELFFVARDLFRRFFGLKYGISFVLVFVGLQSLLHNFFTLTALVSLSVIVGAIGLSIAASAVLNLGKGDIGTDNIGPAGPG
mmetsp:Transcript_10733/g.33432  ORF Transcript_10733/g.33432 Transcript_10733/m.33432 type:complete len:576 (-) Transcript_10733:125-1852(-)